MDKKEEKIIMYDSPEAASIQTLTGWVSSGEGGYPSRYYGKDEHMARWAGCTHMKCKCGNIHKKTYTMCSECGNKKAMDYYTSLPFKEWDGIQPVFERGGDRYFFSLDDLEVHMQENEIEEIDLFLCEEIGYSQVDFENIASEAHEDWEPSEELKRKVKELNDYIDTLPAHSYTPGKIRTSHKIKLEDSE